MFIRHLKKTLLDTAASFGVKQECIYLHDFQSVAEVKKALSSYFQYYNYERLHQGLAYRTPAEVYSGSL